MIVNIKVIVKITLNQGRCVRRWKGKNARIYVQVINQTFLKQDAEQLAWVSGTGIYRACRAIECEEDDGCVI